MAIISKRIVDLLNYRIEQEEASSRLYLAMSIWLGFNGFLGAEKLWTKYSEEEFVHAGWVREYLLDLDIMPITPKLEQPTQDFGGLMDIIKRSYAHEVNITAQCQNLAGICVTDNDYMTLGLAQRFLKEQVEEISKITALLDKLEAFGDSPVALRLLDNELGE